MLSILLILPFLKSMQKQIWTFADRITAQNTMKNDLHPQIQIMKENRLSELQTVVDTALGEMTTIRRELGIEQKPKDGKTPAEQFQAERDAKPSPFKD